MKVDEKFINRVVQKYFVESNVPLPTWWNNKEKCVKKRKNYIVEMKDFRKLVNIAIEEWTVKEIDKKRKGESEDD